VGAPGEPRWAVVVPLKPLSRGKTRLADDGTERGALALAFARDVVAAALASPCVVDVVVVTDDARAGAVLRADGARTVGEDGGGLNGAFESGARVARGREAGVGVAALMGDLPALRAEELTQALTTAWDFRRCYVPDAAGTGTTLLTARPGVGLGAAFGLASADEHLASGARLLELEGCPGLQQDVDTADDLVRAVELGLGPATRRALAPGD